MLKKILCNPKNCLQSTVYLTGQTVWIIFAISAIAGIFTNKSPLISSIKNKLFGKFIVSIIGMIVFASLMYMLINYLCSNGYTTVSWILSFLPFALASMLGYNLIKFVMPNKMNGMDGMDGMDDMNS